MPEGNVAKGIKFIEGYEQAVDFTRKDDEILITTVNDDPPEVISRIHEFNQFEIQARQELLENLKSGIKEYERMIVDPDEQYMFKMEEVVIKGPFQQYGLDIWTVVTKEYKYLGDGDFEYSSETLQVMTGNGIILSSVTEMYGETYSSLTLSSLGIISDERVLQ